MGRRTCEEGTPRVDDGQCRLSVVFVAHSVEVDDKALRCDLEKLPQTRAEDHVVRLATHENFVAEGGFPWGQAFRVHERLIQVTHEVNLLVTELVLQVSVAQQLDGGGLLPLDEAEIFDRLLQQPADASHRVMACYGV